MKDVAKVIFFANTDWYLFNFRLALAQRLRSEGIEVLMLSPPGEYGDQLRSAGFRWEPVSMDRRSLNPLKELRLIKHLMDRFRRERPTVVHGFTLKCAVYGSIAARLARVPGRVADVAGLGYVFSSESARARWLRPVVRGLLRVGIGGTGSRLIVQNPGDVAQLREGRVAGTDRIRLIPSSGVDCERFRPHADGGPPERPFRVLFSGRLLWDKGLGEYVEAARLLRAEGRDVTFLVAGTPDPGNPGSVPERTVEGWVQKGLVDWLGHVEDMAELIRTTHVLVLPSYYGEGVPRSLIEGAASGVPLVTTDMPGCREVVTDGREGLLVPPRDAPSLARAVARIQDDPALARRLGRAGRAKVIQEFDARLVLDRTLATYRELVTLPTSPRIPEGAPSNPARVTIRETSE